MLFHKEDERGYTDKVFNDEIKHLAILLSVFNFFGRILERRLYETGNDVYKPIYFKLSSIMLITI